MCPSLHAEVVALADLSAESNGIVEWSAWEVKYPFLLVRHSRYLYEEKFPFLLPES